MRLRPIAEHAGGQVTLLRRRRTGRIRTKRHYATCGRQYLLAPRSGSTGVPPLKSTHGQDGRVTARAAWRCDIPATPLGAGCPCRSVAARRSSGASIPAAGPAARFQPSCRRACAGPVAGDGHAPAPGAPKDIIEYVSFITWNGTGVRMAARPGISANSARSSPCL